MYTKVIELQNTEMHMNVPHVTYHAIVIKAKVFKKKNSRITNLWEPEGPEKFGIAQTRPESRSRVRKAPALHRKRVFLGPQGLTGGNRLPKKPKNPASHNSEVPTWGEAQDAERWLKTSSPSFSDEEPNFPTFKEIWKESRIHRASKLSAPGHFGDAWPGPWDYPRERASAEASPRKSRALYMSFKKI